VFKGESCKDPCVDLILVDMPESLPVPTISDPPGEIPEWNTAEDDWLDPIFDFADNHLVDDGAIIIIHPYRQSTKANILGYSKATGFTLFKDWTCMNRLHLASPVNHLKTVNFHPLSSFLSSNIVLLFLSTNSFGYM
jgi:hypothetical protein